MGCGSSSDLTAARRRTLPTNADGSNKTRLFQTQRDSFDASDMIYFDEILSNVSRIGLAPNISPVVCSGKGSFPVVVSKVPQIGAHDSRTFLPIVSASVHGRGRVLCFPNVSYLTSQMLSLKDTSGLMRNSFHFLCGTTPNPKVGCAFGFSSDLHDSITLLFQQIGISITIIQDEFPSNLSDYRFLMIPSTFMLQGQYENIESFVSNEGGLAVFFDHNDSHFSINDLIHRFGLTYVPIIMNLEDSEKGNIRITTDFEQVRDLTLIKQIARFKTSIHQKSTNESSFDQKVVSLKYHFLSCGVYALAETKSVLKTCLHFLEKSKTICPYFYCDNHRFGLIATLAILLSQIIPPQETIAFPGANSFPGECKSLELSNFDILVVVNPESWVSTGLYLTPGCCCEVVCNSEPM